MVELIEHVYKDLYNQDSVDKQLLIEFDGGSITNEELYADAFEVIETLCSEDELRFGCCEASEVKFKIANVVEEMKDKWLNISETLNGDTSNSFVLGKYKVFSDVPSGDRNYREITAYDVLYDVLNADVSEWYESIEFPITQKQLRDSFFAYFGIDQNETALIHDGMTIEKTIDATSISGKEVLVALCELNGVFGHIDRTGSFEYVSLDKDEEYVPIEIDGSLYKSCEYDDFVTKNISKLQIRQEENDIGYVYGEGDNCYIIEDNFLVYGKTSEEMATICQNLYNKISQIAYRPFKAVIKGNPCYTVGDSIKIESRYKTIESYILERRITGIQALFDEVESKGVYEYAEDLNNVLKDIVRLKGKTNILERTLEKTRSEIKDVEANLKTEIEQTANSISLEVGKAVNDLEIGSVNIIRYATTLDYVDYYFESNIEGDILLDENGEMITDEYGYVLVG